VKKLYQDYTIEVTNPGGHSSRPVPDNAIYELGSALMKVQSLEFPIEFNDATTGFFRRMGAITPGQEGQDMRDAADGENAAAIRRLMVNPSYNATFRTTCVATMLNAGHAPNALPPARDRQRQLPHLPGPHAAGNPAEASSRDWR